MWCSNIHDYVSSEIPWLNIRDLQTPWDPLAYLISKLPPSWPSVTFWLKAAPQGKLQIVPNLEMVSERKIEWSPLVTGFVKMLRPLSLTPWYNATPSTYHRPNLERIEHPSKGLPYPAPHLSYQQSRQPYFQSSSGIQPLLTIFQVTVIPHLLAS